MSDRSDLERAIAAQEELRGTVPDDIVDTTIAALRARLDGMPLVGPTVKRRRQVTVLFADVSGSTALGESLDPEVIGDTLDVLWTRLDRVISAHNGRIDKHIGDAVMALWGANEAREDDAEQAIRAALAIQEEVADLPAFATGARLALRVGINTGPVILGEVGTTGEFTAIGDAVNVAARLEGAAPVGGVLIGHDTYRHVKGVFAVRAMDPIIVKGKAKPLRTYVVDGVRPRAFRVATRGIEGVETAMIGRDAELGTLQRALADTARLRSSHLVTVVGEAGIGKSRLLNAFEEWLALREDDTWLFRARADEAQQVAPNALVRDLLFTRFEISETDPGPTALTKLEAGAVGFMGNDGIEAAHFLGHLIGLDLSDSPYIGGIIDDARQLRDRAVTFAARLVGAAAAAAPVTILLEDVHWADGSSLDLLREILFECAAMPLFVVALTRPLLFERRPDWGEAAVHHDRVDLEPLSPDASRRLVAEILQRLGTVPETVTAAIATQAEGNPFYVEEIVKMLIDGGVITTGEEAWTVSVDRLDHLEVPPTLTGVIQARLDRLPADERSTLQRASVVGRVFWDDAIPEPLQPSSPASRREELAALRDRSLIAPTGETAFAGTDEYTFHHALLHEVTYETVLLRDRARLHRLVAEWLVGRTERGAHAAAIGRHYLAARDLGEAAAWFATAGTDAAARFANDEALENYQHAIGLGTLDPPTLLKVYERKTEVLLLQARYEEALAASLEIRAVAEAAGDPAAAASALVGSAFPLLRMGRSREALEACRSAETLLRGADPLDRSALAEALRSQAWMLLRLGEGKRGLLLAEEGLTLATAAGDRRETARCLGVLGGIHNMLGGYAEAAGYFDRALAIDRERGDRHAETTWLINLGETARYQGDYAWAESLHLEALALESDLGDRDQEALTLSNLGGSYVGMGDYDRAIVNLERSLQAFASTGYLEHVSETHRFLAEAALGVGDVRRAHDEARIALAQAGPNDADQQGHAWRVLGLVAAATTGAIEVDDGGGETRVDSAACFERSLAAFAEGGLDHERALCLWDRARIEWDGGDRVRAAQWWHEARETFARLGLERFTTAMDAERPAGKAPPG